MHCLAGQDAACPTALNQLAWSRTGYLNTRPLPSHYSFSSNWWLLLFAVYRLRTWNRLSAAIQLHSLQHQLKAHLLQH